MSLLRERNNLLLLISIFTAMVAVGMCLQMFSFSYPSIMEEMGLGRVETGILGSCLLLGMGVGGFASGFFADGYGRLKVVRVSMVLLPAANIFVFLSDSYRHLSLGCFLSGMFAISIYYIGTLAVAENIESEVRATVLGIMQSGWSLGYILSAMVYSWITVSYGWRFLFLLPMLASIISLSILIRVDETKGKDQVGGRGAGKLGSIRTLLQNLETRRMFMLWGTTLFALQFGYYGFSTWLPLYLLEEGLDIARTGLYVTGIYSAMFFGKILTGMIADRAGRKRLWVFVGLVTSILLPGIVFLVDGDNIGYVMPLFGLFYGAPYAILSTYLAESFPGHIRGSAVASTNTMGKAGAALSPVFIGIISDRISISAGLAFLGIAYLVAALIPGILIDEKIYDPGRISKI